MNLNVSDIDTITMYRFEPIRGSQDYKHGMSKIKAYVKSSQSIGIMLQSNQIARGICESFKTKR